MKVAVIGAGTMGIGIAQVVASAGYDVMLISDHEASLKAGLGRLNANLDKAMAKGGMSAEQKAACLGHVKTSSTISDVGGAGILIEAVPEELKIKSAVISEAEKYLDKNAIIATNTSSISISTLSNSLKDPSRFLGLHFFNPAPVMKVIEVVLGEKTSAETVNNAKSFVETLSKTPVEVKDSPGFISNRILMIYINESINAFDQGIADRDAIDTIARLGFHHPMGPLELADFIGLDVCMDIMDAIYQQSNDEKFKPSPLLVRMVKEGRLGRKNKKGFYDYP
ncbi:MAG: 3-hydroxyacyl-CoA dehydrogenase family protein [Candidatus Micrarchaeota archaeon]|nr:3-hydroxyacyl-CoA dehydrogenase family protein [Candidatus Micrarchaeota archaeon]